MTKFTDIAPNDHTSLIRRLETLEREVRELRAARRLEAATIGKGGVTVKDGGSVRVIDGGILEVTSGTLVLGDQIIHSEALSIAFDGVDAYAQNFSIPLAPDVNPRVSAQIPIPAWATSGIVHVFAHASITNTRAVTDTVFITADAYIGDGPVELYKTFAASERGVISNSSQRTFTKSVGDGWTALDVGASLQTLGAAWPVDGNNRITLSAMAIFKA